MLGYLRTGVIVMALFVVAAGVAAADPLPVADVSRSVDTVDGYHFSLSLTAMTINSVPNMAATAFTREGFLTGTATATIDDNGSAPVNTVKLSIFAQVGCQINIVNGGTLGLAGDDNGAVADFLGGNPSGGLTPSGTLNLNPGYIGVVPIADKTITADLNRYALKDLAGHQFENSADDFEVRVDTCAGPVSVRLVARALMSTDNVDKTLTVYGDIFSL